LFAIIKMEDRHVKQAAELEAACFSRPWSEKAISDWLGNELAFFACAEEEGCFAGYAGMYAIAGTGNILNIAVGENFRRRGIGRELIKALEIEAERLQLWELTLEVRKSNLNAINLYTSCGFEQVGLRPGYYEQPKEDGIIMTKVLR